MLPGEALHGRCSGPGELAAALRLVVEVTQGLRQRLRVGRRDQHAVDSVADDVAVARDIRGDDGRSRGEGLGEHHAEALAAERGRRQHICGQQLLVLGRVVDLSERADPARVDQQRRELGLARPDHGQLRGDVLAQRLERAQQQRQPLAFDRLSDEQDPQHVVFTPACQGPIERLLVELDAVGDHAVAPTEPAPPAPRGRLRDSDPHSQPVQHLRGAEAVGDRVRKALGRVGMEGPDQRHAERQRGRPTDHRRDRFVDVGDVVAPTRELAGELGHAVWPDQKVRDSPVGAEADGPSERHQVIRLGQALRPRAAVHDSSSSCQADRTARARAHRVQPRGTARQAPRYASSRPPGRTTNTGRPARSAFANRIG